MPRRPSKRTNTTPKIKKCQLCESEPARAVYGRPTTMKKLTGHPHQNAWLCDECYERLYNDYNSNQRKNRTGETGSYVEDDIASGVLEIAWGDV